MRPRGVRADRGALTRRRERDCLNRLSIGGRHITAWAMKSERECRHAHDGVPGAPGDHRTGSDETSPSWTTNPAGEYLAHAVSEW